MVNRAVVGAHYGLKDWLLQRVTAVVAAVYTLFLAAYWLTHTPLQYVAWKGLFGSTWMRVCTLVAVANVLLHAWVGVRDILMDYIHGTAVRLTLEVLVLLALAGYGTWSVLILWGR
jgi:succinate dehydrogenase / fumarate reductase, membrane anchor subunit